MCRFSCSFSQTSYSFPKFLVSSVFSILTGRLFFRQMGNAHKSGSGRVVYPHMYVNAKRGMCNEMRHAFNTISPAVMEYARAAGLLAEWRLIVLSRHCQYFPKQSKCRESRCVTKRRRFSGASHRHQQYTVSYYSMHSRTQYNIPCWDIIFKFLSI